MQRNVNILEEQIKEIYDYQIDPHEVEKRFTDLEGCSRRNNQQQIVVIMLRPNALS